MKTLIEGLKYAREEEGFSGDLYDNGVREGEVLDS